MGKLKCLPIAASFLFVLSGSSLNLQKGNNLNRTLQNRCQQNRLHTIGPQKHKVNRLHLLVDSSFLIWELFSFSLTLSRQLLPMSLSRDLWEDSLISTLHISLLIGSGKAWVLLEFQKAFYLAYTRILEYFRIIYDKT